MRPSRAMLRRVGALETSAEAQAHGEPWSRLPLKILLWGQFALHLLQWLTGPELDEWAAAEAAVEAGEKTRVETHDQVTRIFAKVEARRDAANSSDFVPTFFRELEQAQHVPGA